MTVSTLNHLGNRRSKAEEEESEGGKGWKRMEGIVCGGGEAGRGRDVFETRK